MKQFLSVRPLANTSLNDNLNNTNAANGTSTGSNSSKLSSTALAEVCKPIKHRADISEALLYVKLDWIKNFSKFLKDERKGS